MRVKLVRDRMEIGQGGRVQTANSLPGKQALLLLKLHEEAEEIAQDASDPCEYADMIEVLLELARLNNVKWSDIESCILKKREIVGGFRQGRTWISDEIVRIPWPPSEDAGAA